MTLLKLKFQVKNADRETKELKKRTERNGKSMGLAASQARLLSITRRISDNELRAQLINNQKMRLTSESSRVSENYINALNSTNLMFTNYGVNDARQTVPLTYNELTAYNQYNNQYVLSDVAGSVFLNEDEAQLYIQNKGDLAGYLKAHGIEYTTTYWDTIGSLIPDSEVPAAAIIRAWYEEKGLDASAGVEGIEGCSVFPILEDIAEKYRNAIANYETDDSGPNGPAVFADYGSQDIKQEFFNVLLGTSYHGEGQWGYYDGATPLPTSSTNNLANLWGVSGIGQNPYWLNSDEWHYEYILHTINDIIDGINAMKFDSLNSKAFSSSAVDTAYMRSLITNGYDDATTNTQNITRTDVLSKIIANITAGNVIKNHGNGDLYVQFKRYDSSGGTTYRYGDLKEFNNDLLLEFVYPVAIDFFNTHGMPVYGYMKQDSAGHWEDATAEAEWYTNLFNKVEQCGYKTLERGLASSQDWIRFALENGIGIIEQLNTVDTWNKITYNSCSDITEETNSQKATLAEAEYNKAMNQIQAKDERLDLELKNIDTEHSALQKEYESVQKAMTDNVSRTFKMFS